MKKEKKNENNNKIKRFCANSWRYFFSLSFVFFNFLRFIFFHLIISSRSTLIGHVIYIYIYIFLSFFFTSFFFSLSTPSIIDKLRIRTYTYTMIFHVYHFRTFRNLTSSFRSVYSLSLSFSLRFSLSYSFSQCSQTFIAVFVQFLIFENIERR